MLARYQERDNVTQQLYSRLKSRADVTTLEQRNVVPSGYFADAVCYLFFVSVSNGYSLSNSLKFDDFTVFNLFQF